MIVYIRNKPYEIIEPAEYGICHGDEHTDITGRMLAVDEQGRLRIVIEFSDAWEISVLDPLY
jgi:hypothetical protein